jgi:ABC-type nitrate/sulfonate/bicarbonate transport system substrate-binding protein
LKLADGAVKKQEFYCRIKVHRSIDRRCRAVYKRERQSTKIAGRADAAFRTGVFLVVRKVSTGIAFFLVVVLAPTPRASARNVRIALPGYNVTQIVFFAAKERGFYKEEGLDVDLIQMTGTLANLALVTGEVEFSSVPAAAMSANLRGANLRVLFSSYERPLFWLITRAPIRDVKELKGKKMGVPGFNAVTYFMLREFLSKHGLEPGKDYTLLQAGDTAPRLLALQNNFIDATLLPLPWNIIAQESGLYEGASMTKGDIIVPNGAIVAREELLRTDPTLVEQFTRATLKGLRFTLERRPETISIITRSIKVKENLAAKSYDAARPAFTADGTFSDDSQKKAVESALRIAGVKEPAPVEKFFNFTVTKKVAAELQAKNWKP